MPSAALYSSFKLPGFFWGPVRPPTSRPRSRVSRSGFPKKERALATGLFNSGTNIGAVVGTSLVAWLTLRWSWRAAFVFTGSLGFVWLIAWPLLYRAPERHPWLRQEEFDYITGEEASAQGAGQSRLSWREILLYRQAWGFILAKFLTDPIWWFYIFWLPSYLEQGRGYTLKQIEMFAWIPFFAASFGGTLGGWLSGLWMKRGWSVNRARKTALLVMAVLMPAGIVAALAPTAWAALALISLAMAAHQGWSANVFTLASDVFSKKDVGSIVGLGGAAGALGGMIIAPVAGYTLQFTHSYTPLFIIAGVMHPLAIGVIHWLIPKVEPVAGA